MSRPVQPSKKQGQPEVGSPLPAGTTLRSLQGLHVIGASTPCQSYDTPARHPRANGRRRTIGTTFFPESVVTTAVGRGLSDVIDMYNREEKAAKLRQHSVSCIAGRGEHLIHIPTPSILVQSFLLLKLLFLW